MYFAQNLIHLRLKAGETQKDIAEFLGTSEMTISRYESGENEPDLSKTIEIAKHYDTPIDVLLMEIISDNIPTYIKNIKYLRKKHGMTQKDVAEFLGYKGKQGYGAVETGVVGMSADNLIKLADYFEVTTDYLLYHEPCLKEEEPVVYHYGNLSQLISLHRRRMNLTQEELADKLGVRQCSISLYEIGSRRPCYETLIAMAKLFGVSLDELMDASPNRLTQDDPETMGEEPNEELPLYIKNIKWLRKQSGMTQGTMADYLGFKDRSSLCLLESGKTSLSIEKLSMLAYHFHVTLDELVNSDLTNSRESVFQEIINTIGSIKQSVLYLEDLVEKSI